MKLEQSFDVAAPLDEVWRALIDVERVAPCLPGAAVTARQDDGTYAGAFTVKIGPTTAAYTGTLEMVSVDEDTHVATMRANGTDKRGQGGAKATIISRLEAADGGTRVTVDTDYSITGRLARFGRGGMIADISERLLREFATRLQASLEGPAEAVADVPAEVATEPVVADEPVAADPPAVADEPAAADEPVASVASEPIAAVPNEPLDAGSLVGSVIRDRLRANPLPVLGPLVLLVVLLLARRRRR